MLSLFAARETTAQRGQVLARPTGWTKRDLTEQKAAWPLSRPLLPPQLIFPRLTTSEDAHSRRAHGCFLSPSCQHPHETYL